MTAVIKIAIVMVLNDNGELLEKIEYLENGNYAVTYIDIDGIRNFKIMTQKRIQLNWEIKL